MNANLHIAIAQSHRQDLHREARQARLARELPRRQRLVRFSQLAKLVPSGGHRSTAPSGRIAQA